MGRFNKVLRDILYEVWRLQVDYVSITAKADVWSVRPYSIWTKPYWALDRRQCESTNGKASTVCMKVMSVDERKLIVSQEMTIECEFNC
jgi:hypothetical protein